MSFVVPKDKDFDWESYWGKNPGLQFLHELSWLSIAFAVAILLTAVIVVWATVYRKLTSCRFQFSVRTVAITTTIFAVYCAVWRLTNTSGVQRELGNDVQELYQRSGVTGYAVAPFVVCVQSPAEMWRLPDGAWHGSGTHRRFVLWNPNGKNIALYP